MTGAKLTPFAIVSLWRFLLVIAAKHRNSKSPRAAEDCCIGWLVLFVSAVAGQPLSG
jgi:hypothetical protein